LLLLRSLGLAPQALCCRPLRGLGAFIVAIPGACAPGFMLSPASRARCFYCCDPWGLRPRLYAVARFAGSVLLLLRSLGLAPQALCCRPLRGLGAFIVAIPGACHPRLLNSSCWL